MFFMIICREAQGDHTHEVQLAISSLSMGTRTRTINEMAEEDEDNDGYEDVYGVEGKEGGGIENETSE